MSNLVKQGEEVLDWGVFMGHISKQEAQNYGVKLYKVKNPKGE